VKVVREVRRVQHLNAGIVLAIEWRHRVWAAGVLGVCRRVEPKPQMVGLHRGSRRILICIREWRIVEDFRCRRDTGGNDECLDAEAPPEMLDGVAVGVGWRGRLGCALGSSCARIPPARRTCQRPAAPARPYAVEVSRASVKLRNRSTRVHIPLIPRQPKRGLGNLNHGLSFKRAYDDQMEKSSPPNHAGETATSAGCAEGRASAIIRRRRDHVQADAERLRPV
jgi:hypothetical protein